MSARRSVMSEPTSLVFDSWAYLSFVLVAAVCWSRVLLRDHTLAQTVVGVLLGVGITLTVWRLIT